MDGGLLNVEGVAMWTGPVPRATHIAMVGSHRAARHSPCDRRTTREAKRRKNVTPDEDLKAGLRGRAGLRWCRAIGSWLRWKVILDEVYFDGRHGLSCIQGLRLRVTVTMSTEDWN